MAKTPPELYSLEADGGRLRFTPLSPGTALPSPLAVVHRMGDPALIQCAVLRRENAPGGVFRLEDANGPLLAAIAPDNLTFALGMGFFGELTANARYGVDVFENMEEPDD
ncbi:MULTISPECIES: hypothetical protein [unclassified Desulfovibrio]|uniref:hypothetical protein n=1 Tax=unclassified Desulfovibrio TaxID=2593640 RepID=UPI0013ED1D1D|nr:MULTISPECIES: hypothetical protein [unclassified Desulfovibrio]